MNRRGFLGGILAGVALVSVPAIFPEVLPTLYADGINDDSEGLLAMATGRPFRTADGFEGYATAGIISGALLFLPNGLKLEHDAKITIMNCIIKCRAAHITAPASNPFIFYGNIFMGGSAEPPLAGSSTDTPRAS